MPAQYVSTGLGVILAPLRDVGELENCRVDYSSLSRLHSRWYKCNLLLFAENGYDIRVRVFMDDPGFLEDAATGSANGALAAYLLKYNYFGTQAIAYQALQGIEMGRPSVLHVVASMKDGSYSIEVGGDVKEVASGDWL